MRLRLRYYSDTRKTGTRASMRPQQWIAISPSRFDWEREALEFLRAHLPDHEPWRAWANFEFIDDEGKVNEVDLLVLTPAGLVLLEIKSRPGTVEGDASGWKWMTDGRSIEVDNPLLLANRKAKRLASLLRHQDAFGRSRLRSAVPWIEPVIFLSAVRQQPRLDPGTSRRVFLRGNPASEADNGIINALLHADQLGFARRGIVDSHIARATAAALEQAGIRAAKRARRIGDYELGELLGEGQGWQDFAAKHVSTGVARRVRIYPYARAASPESRDRLARTAQREFKVLEGVEHPGILRALDFRESEVGPALVFEHDPSAMRLDRFLASRLDGLSLDQRLALLRQLAETIAYAHRKRLHHRGLAPQNVLVRDVEGERPRLLVMNWLVASRGEGSANPYLITAGTRHIEDYFPDPAKVYLAPEALSGDDDATGILADVFSLGAIAYHLIAGRAPADNPLDLPNRLRAGDGLRLSDSVDGVGQGLEEMVRVSTAPLVGSRVRSVAEFLDYLKEAEAEQRPPLPIADPSTAGAGDRLESGLTVVKRLGRGSTADAILVKRDEDEELLVLKVAIDAAHADRVRSEAEILRRLRHHQNIVRFDAEITISGRPGILMEQAGEKTLAQWLRGNEQVSLDLMRRFGEHLLQAVVYLEQEGITHRDIKPDNLGVAKSAGSGAYRLVLFDFSLSRTPPENIEAGTRPYLDPFLANRGPPARWDLYAERYAAAVTLHEMMAGAPPIFGDGVTDPLVTDDEATIASERFDPVLRDGLTEFFDRALKRDPNERFGNAEEMLRAWQRAFEPMDRKPIPEGGIELIARRLDRNTSIADLGYGIEARDVLDKMGIHTVQQLLAVDRIRFRYLRGVGDRIRKEIRERAKRLAQLRPDLVPGGATEDGRGWASLDRLVGQLLPRRPAGIEVTEDRILAEYLGLEPAEGPVLWHSPGAVARSVGVARSVVAEALERARERWHKSHEINELRAEIVGLLEAAGGVATTDELTSQLLAARGSVEESEADRSRLAHAVLRAAVELEASMAAPRFASFMEAAPILVATSPELADYARRLGREADRLAGADPLPSPGQAAEELERVPAPENTLPLPYGRRLRLATAASTGAALSARLELYPRGMVAENALRLSLGALAGPQMLTEAAVRERVRGRFPEASPLPPRPELDTLLDQLGAERVWRDDGAMGPGYYSRLALDSNTGTSGFGHYDTLSPPPEVTPEILDARALEEKIAHAAKTGAFLALTAEPHRNREAEAELLRRFPREVVSLERLMLQAMRAEAEARHVPWLKVLAADAASRDSRDFHNLLRHASRAAPRVREQVMALRRPALLIRPGLLARYDLMDMLTVFAQASGTRDGPPGLWLLVPQPDAGMPRVNGAVLPVISSANWARLTDAWIANAHRAGGRARPAA
jgi:serine/threonine protein kinase